MNLDRLRSPIGITENRQGNVRSFHEMKEILETFNFSWADIPSNEKRYIRRYFHTQKLIAENKPEKADRIFRSVSHREDYSEFEEKNRFLLSLIDVAVKGKAKYRYSNP